jgi:glycosyltransferase involved in cell wall biosynthesis
MPEVAGEAALLVDPRSPAEVSSALGRLLASPDLRARLGREAALRSRQFTWEHCARRSLEFFRRLS